MPQSLAKVYVHIVFSTKNRKPFLHDRPLRLEMHAYLVGACNGQDSPSILVGGVADHVHILCRLSRTRTLAELVREIKRTSSKWIKTKGLRHFGWQNGYGAFSVSPSHVARVRRYIARQDSPSILVGGVADHVHILCRLSRTRTLAELVREIKRTSSKWIKTKGLRHFGWQNGYGAFSVSPSHVARVRRYIARQEEHHRKQSFQDEYRGFLDRYGIDYDERYVWD